jgi:hypothetical protein
MAFGKTARQRGRRDQVARGLEAEEGNRLLDGGDLDLQPIQRGIGQPQGLGRQRLIVRDFLGQYGDIDIFLIDAVE